MILSQLASSVFDPDPLQDLKITSVTDRSNLVQPGALFVAIRGRTVDGHRYLADAAARGAVAAVVSHPVSCPIPCFPVPDVRRAYALLCGNFYGNPAKNMVLTGITGTNGKTSTACLLEHCLRSCGTKTALLGTVCTDDGATVCDSSLTTPDPSVLHAVLARARDNGCSHAVLEVSSQSLDQRRVSGLEFAVGIFTNLSVDHLDYHGTMQAYRDAKQKLFYQCRTGLVNSDSDYVAPFLTLPGMKTFSVTHPADFTATRVRMTTDGISYVECSPSGRREVSLPMRGRFSIYNSLAALAAAECLGLDADACAEALRSFPGVRGRMETVRGDLPFRLLIDYAHTPDGLKLVLQSLRDTAGGRIILVFGCGGDRDEGKRPEMGRIASSLADEVIVTTDNPRSEDPEEIIRQILSGAVQPCRVVADRTEAIRTALRLAQAGDTVLLAGKGHETRQIFADGSIPYDEREIARKLLKEEGY